MITKQESVMKGNMQFVNFVNLFSRVPDGVAIISGSRDYPAIHGVVRFYSVKSGVMVRAEISGLPRGNPHCGSPVFGFHIHSGSLCSGNSSDPFADAMGHFDPASCPHPYHAGDLPPLFGAGGRAVSVFLTDRFSVPQILGKAIIIHSSPDDFHSQPSGNSGSKIACGIIVPVRR